MEVLLVEQQRQDWSMFEYAGQLVCRDVEGWQVRARALLCLTAAGRAHAQRMFTACGQRVWGRGLVACCARRVAPARLDSCSTPRLAAEPQSAQDSSPTLSCPFLLSRGRQAVVSALPVKPMLLREPCPDLLLERFTPGPCGEAPRVYPADLARECSTLGGPVVGGMLAERGPLPPFRWCVLADSLQDAACFNSLPLTRPAFFGSDGRSADAGSGPPGRLLG